MRALIVALAATALLLVGCSDSGDEQAFEGDAIDGDTVTDDTRPEPSVTDPERVELEPDGTVPATTVPPIVSVPPVVTTAVTPSDLEITSFRSGLELGGLSGAQIDCLVEEASGLLNLSEAQLDELVVEDPQDPWLAVAGQAAMAECLPDGIPRPSGAPGGVVVPPDASATLSEQLADLGMTPSEAGCLAEMFADEATAAENKDFLACLSMDRLIELAS
jgi:hypothetical protein